VGVIGLVLMIDPRHNVNVFSDACGIAGAVLWAAGVVVTRKTRGQGTFDPLSFTAWQVLFGSIPLVAIALAMHEGPVVPATPALLAVAYNGVLATGLAFVLFAYAIDHLSAPLAGAGSLSIPVIGVVATALQLGERPTGLEWAGMICVVGALVLMVRPPHFARPQSPLGGAPVKAPT
jgi:drug/metabolite transporter (DMT)-like permease